MLGFIAPLRRQIVYLLRNLLEAPARTITIAKTVDGMTAAAADSEPMTEAELVAEL